MALPRTTNSMCFCMVQHSRTFRKPVAAWIWRRGLHSIPAHQRWPPPNVSADHLLGVSPRPVPVAPDLEQDLPANGVVLLTTRVPHFADAHRPLPGPLTPAQALNRGEPPRAARLRGPALTVANPATSRRTADCRVIRCTSTCPAPPHQPPRKVPVAPHADVVVVIEGVDVTAADEPVARETSSGEGWG